MKRIDKIRKRLKTIRTERGYSQDYVGEQLHMSQIAYHKLENGKTILKVRTLLELAVILGVKESYLLGSEEWWEIRNIITLFWDKRVKSWFVLVGSCESNRDKTL